MAQVLKKEIKVIVFCYEHEGSYSIPGKNSILKINEPNDPISVSIKKYIKTGQNPMAIKEDMKLWVKKGFGNDLKQLIKRVQCKETFDDKK